MLRAAKQAQLHLRLQSRVQAMMALELARGLAWVALVAWATRPAARSRARGTGARRQRSPR